MPQNLPKSILENKDFVQPAKLRDGSTGIKIDLGEGKPGGYYSEDGNPTTFWYN